MPKEYLPIDPLKNLREQTSQNLVSPLINKVEIEKDPSSASYQIVEHSSNVSRNVILVVCFIFLLLNTLSIILDVNFKKYKQRTDDLINTVESYSNVESTYNDLFHRLSLYKNIKEKQTPISEKTKIVYASITPSVTLDKVNISDSEFNVSLTGPNALVFARIISQYLEEDLISQMILTSANLKTRDDSYSVGLKGIFK